MIQPFVYSGTEHQRRHGPDGYTNYKTYKDWLRDEFAFRCVYCLVRERWYPNTSNAFCVEHSKPQREAPELALSYDNLLYACNTCNSFKSDTEDILNPCTDAMADHLAVLPDGTINPLTTVGCILVDALDLNGPDIVSMRKDYLVFAQGLNDGSLRPPDVADTIRSRFAFPDDLPDLRTSKPPKNSRPDGVNATYFVRRSAGSLPATY